MKRRAHGALGSVVRECNLRCARGTCQLFDNINVTCDGQWGGGRFERTTFEHKEPCFSPMIVEIHVFATYPVLLGTWFSVVHGQLMGCMRHSQLSARHAKSAR